MSKILGKKNKYNYFHAFVTECNCGKNLTQYSIGGMKTNTFNKTDTISRFKVVCYVNGFKVWSKCLRVGEIELLLNNCVPNLVREDFYERREIK